MPLAMISPDVHCRLCVRRASDQGEKRLRHRNLGRTIVLGLFTLSGCGIGTGVAKAGQSVESLGKSVERSSAELAKGLRGLDPVALNKLLNENAELRKQLLEVRNRIDGRSLGTGNIVLKDNRLLIQVTDYRGTFRIDGWVDEPDTWFWQNRTLAERNPELPFNFGGVSNRLFQKWRDAALSVAPPTVNRAQFAESAVWATLRANPEQLYTHLTRHANTVATNYLRASKAVELAGAPSVDLQSQIGDSGTHVIGVRITPIALDVTGKWGLRGQLLSIAPSGATQVLKEFDVSSDQTPGATLNAPLGDILMKVTVQATATP